MTPAPKIDPHMPVECDKATQLALIAFANGRADENEQRVAFRWIVSVASAQHDLSYRPGGLEGDRATCFAAGRAFVGQQILKHAAVLNPYIHEMRKPTDG